jgi:hypothetical protein
MTANTDEHLRFQDHNGRNRFELEVRKWAKVSMRPINDAIIEEMYGHIQAIGNPMDYSLPGSYFTALQPIVNPDDDSE